MIPEINKQLEALAKEKGLTYINLFPLFTEKEAMCYEQI